MYIFLQWMCQECMFMQINITMLIKHKRTEHSKHQLWIFTLIQTESFGFNLWNSSTSLLKRPNPKKVTSKQDIMFYSALLSRFSIIIGTLYWQAHHNDYQREIKSFLQSQLPKLVACQLFNSKVIILSNTHNYFLIVNVGCTM